MIKIVLTGGIGAGKSTVCGYFSRLHVPIIDADQIARACVAIGKPAYLEIKTYFGEGILQQPQGEIDREKLRNCIFTDLEKKQWLEACLHPKIREEIQNRLASLESPYVIIDIPLYFESDNPFPCDRVLVVDAPVEEQIERVMIRNHLSRDVVETILKTQVCREHRLAAADDIISNTKEKPVLFEDIVGLDQFYRSLVSR